MRDLEPIPRLRRCLELGYPGVLAPVGGVPCLVPFPGCPACTRSAAPWPAQCGPTTAAPTSKRASSCNLAPPAKHSKRCPLRRPHFPTRFPGRTDSGAVGGRGHVVTAVRSRAGFAAKIATALPPRRSSSRHVAQPAPEHHPRAWPTGDPVQDGGRHAGKA